MTDHSGPFSALALADTLLAEKRDQGTYRSFVSLSRSSDAPYPYFFDVQGRKILHMCLNDYLGLSQNHAAKAAAIAAIEQNGTSTCASRNIGGTRELHTRLEEYLAVLHSAEDCSLYGSGNAANSDAITNIARLSNQSIFFSDSENHASIIGGMRGLRNGERKFVFRHNDCDHLKALCRDHLKTGDLPILVVETLYSMAGDFAPLSDMLVWFKSIGGVVILNEVHAVGVIGSGGSGRAAQQGLADYVDLFIGSLSKALASLGGYVAGRRELVDLCRQTGIQSIFTTSLPDYCCAVALSNLRHRAESSDEVSALAVRVGWLRDELDRTQIPHGGDHGSHITPVFVGSEARCLSIHQRLLEKGFYVSAVRYPTVKRGEALLRVSVTPHHDRRDIMDFVSALAMSSH